MKNLSESQTKNLINFFANQTHTHVWKKNHLYTLADHTSILFNYDVIRRKCKNGQDVRYEFLSPHLLNSGSMGSVFDIQATLAIKKNKLHYKQYGYNGKSRVVKVQHHNDKNPTLTAMKEYRLSHQANHLAIKEPVFDGSTSYTVMKKLKGYELFDVINNDLGKNRVLTLNERVELTYALLNALKSQVTDKGIIHRDIKPENIFVELNRPIKVTIFDYGLSILINYKDNKLVGTPGYIPPEVFEHGEQTPAIDIFSMGQVIALLWHAHTGALDDLPQDILEIYEQSKQASLVCDLCHDIRDLDNNARQSLRDLLTKMLKAENHERITIREAISQFRPIYNQYHTPPNPEYTNLENKVRSAKAQISQIKISLDKLSFHCHELAALGKREEASKLNALSEKIKLKLTKLQVSDPETFNNKLTNYLEALIKKITVQQIRYSKDKNITQLFSNLYTMLNDLHAHFAKFNKTPSSITSNKSLFFNRAHANTGRLKEEYSLPVNTEIVGCKEPNQAENGHHTAGSIPLAVF